MKVREEVGSIMAVELEEPVSLRQLRQWQRAWWGDGVSVWSVNGRLKGHTVRAGSPSRV